MKVLAILCLVLGLVCFSLALSPSGYNHVIAHLDKFQTSSGGFSQTEGGQPSIEATSHALFLSSLFGLRKKINTKEAAKYVASLENSDKGFGKSTNMATDVESTRHAVFSYHYLGSSVPNAAEIAKSLSRLRDPETGLFFSRSGEKGDLKSTALALQTLEILRENQRTWVQEGFDKIKAYLAKHAKVEGDRSYFAFPEEKGLSATSANYYGIVLGYYVGFDFAQPRKWAAAIQGLQSQEGGFYTAFDKKTVSVEATSHAVASLRALQQAQKDQGETFVNSINTENLLHYVASVPSDLRAAAQAHLAVALTNSFAKNFDIHIAYEVLRSSDPVGKQVVQGAQIKPFVSVKTHEGVPHAGLDIDVAISYAGQSNAVSAKLKWMDKEYYTPDEFFDTSNHLGEMKFVYNIRCYVVGVGELSFEKTDIKLVGYGVVVDPQATLEVTGKEFRPGETVAIGTDFAFSLTLQNQTHDSLTSGNFDVIFTVLDSSLVAIHTDRINCNGNTKPLKFAYSLKSSNIPSGELAFHFEVAAGGKIHTSEVVTYQLSIPMIATNIQFDGFTRGTPALYKIGQTVKVLIEPASFPDLRNVHAFPAVDVNKQPIADRRHLVMDLSSPSGARLRSVQAKARTDTGHSKYVFEVPITPTLDSIGVNVVSFRYVTAAETSVNLANYDSSLGELYEDASQLNFTVISELHMVDVKEQPKTHDYFYGNDINFRFRVKDALSNQYLEKGKEQGNVYLLLKHKDENRAKTFTSAHEAAQQVVGDKGLKEFVIRWAINPNAVQGNGFLTLSAQGADGHHIDLFTADSKSPVHFEVTIGGQITANSKTFSTSEVNAKETAFVVEFELTCQNKSLKDAQLRCSIFRGDSQTPIYSGLPVATNDAGHYSFALGAPHEELPSGRYKFKFYREVDRKRALETRDLLEKKRLREELLKQTEEGTPVVEESEKADVESSLTPLFELSIYHSAPPTGKSPIRPEFIVALLLGGVFIAISYQKKHYIPLK